MNHKPTGEISKENPNVWSGTFRSGQMSVEIDMCTEAHTGPHGFYIRLWLYSRNSSDLFREFRSLWEL